MMVGIINVVMSASVLKFERIHSTTANTTKAPVAMRRGERGVAAHDIGHALCRIVGRDRQMIGGGRVLAREHDIAKDRRICGDFTARELGEGQRGVDEL